jgi:hypothetical protein
VLGGKTVCTGKPLLETLKWWIGTRALPFHDGVVDGIKRVVFAHYVIEHHLEHVLQVLTNPMYPAVASVVSLLPLHTHREPKRERFLHTVA